MGQRRSTRRLWMVVTLLASSTWTGGAAADPCPATVDTDGDGTLDTAEDTNFNNDCNDDDDDNDGIANFLDCRDGDMDPATGVGVAGFDDLTKCMTDADGDDYGDAAVVAGGGLVAGTDCNDGDATVSPGSIPIGADVGNGLDRDCDGVDECFFDADQDGYGSTVIVADSGDGVCDDFLEAWQASDCEDYDFEIFPGATVTGADVGDGVDRDCDGFDECYADADGDGYGGSTFVADDGDGVCDDAGEDLAVRDCNDNAALISPAATPTAQDVGNGVDRDCDGFDECFFDADQDGYGGTIIADDGDGSCDDFLETTQGADCEDYDFEIFPGATVSDADVGDGIDRDCDGFDECYADADGDGYGGSTFVADDGDGVCNDAGEDFAVRDCNDNAALISPAATPTAQDVGNGVDRDCDGFDECFFDADQDGYGSTIIADDGDGSCDDTAEGLVGGDCEDYDPDIHPGAKEVCDDVDNDCVNGIDDGFVCGVPDAGPTDRVDDEDDAGAQPPDASTGTAGTSGADAATDAGMSSSDAATGAAGMSGSDAATGAAGMSVGDPLTNTDTSGAGSAGSSASGSGIDAPDGSIDEPGASDSSKDSCGCRVVGRPKRDRAVLAWLGLMLGVARLRRRRSRS